MSVAEVFLTAGHAFQKLGDLAMQLQMGPSSIPTEERWSENNVDHLREALTRFAHELDQISNNVQARTTKMISTDIRRRHLMPQRPLASSISSLKRQPAKLGPVIVPKRLNVTRNARQYMPARLSTAPGTVSQVIVPSTKTYPLTRATTSTFTGQRQYVMSVPQAGPSRAVPMMASGSRVSGQPGAQYMPARLSTTPGAVSQVIVPSTKTYPLTRATTSTFTGQRQYVMSVPQAGPSRAVPMMASGSRVSGQPGAVHTQMSSMGSHQGPPALVPVMLEDQPPRLEQRM
ncbi:hypothetical protein OESDEN_06300 [Oesophagostomum dentatum]|uniref:Uncharacterized protein n=1 Tax=Oesophagostomum dentatum TaxID=61180 RepID=A0A0B1T966_OESDE|nr:hypothetical protein OESDEN_06300 [Oesophagostomum dentatum]